MSIPLRNWWNAPLASVISRGKEPLRKNLGIETVGDLLTHYPRRYLNLAEVTSFDTLTEGSDVSIVAEVVDTPEARPMQQRRGIRVTAHVTDGHTTLNLVFFAKANWGVKAIEDALTPGEKVLLSGKITTYRGQWQMTHPHIGSADPTDVQWRQQHPWKPIYTTTGKVTSWTLEKTIRVILDTHPLENFPDPIPTQVLTNTHLPTKGETLRHLHTPQTHTQWQQGRRRIAFEEAFITQAALLRRRAAARSVATTAYPAVTGKALTEFDQTLPFELTAGQRTVGQELSEELASTVPMNRLLQGDVGSGKTLVALRAMLQVVDNGGQCALLAPTEVLAQQHHQSIVALLGELANGGLLGGSTHATTVTCVTGSMGAAAQRTALSHVASGQAGIVVGTHALLYDKVQFAQLGLVVVDEQHRFGVDQRDALRAKGTAPHMLVMTATPIPRTVAMTVFGDLDASVLRELPAGRQPVATHLVPAHKTSWLDRVWARIAEEVSAGRQAFVVCSRIGDEPPAEGDNGISVLDLVQDLEEHPALAGVRCAFLHGRMSADEKDDVMESLRQRTIDVVVATTVIEVGIDIPNATVMVIMDADRFGVSQLHQLRGRIGRGQHPGVCLLVTAQDPDHSSIERLQAVAQTSNGFELAEIDAQLRSEGNVLGAQQSGRSSGLKMLRVMRDGDLIAEARREAELVIAEDPTLANHPELVAAFDEFMGTAGQEYLERS